MPLDRGFYRRTRGLRAPITGTELLGPLLYSIARSLRPRRSLEIGVGYTTPFLLQALADNVADVDRELARLADAGRAEQDMPFAAAAYYKKWTPPVLTAIEVLSERLAEVERVAGRLGLRGYLHPIRHDLRGASKLLPPEAIPLDLAFVDAGLYEAFVAEYWGTVSPDGGTVLFHDPFNDDDGRAFVAALGSNDELAERMGPFEVLTLVEPHKTRQNAILVLRRTVPVAPSP